MVRGLRGRGRRRTFISNAALLVHMVLVVACISLPFLPIEVAVGGVFGLKLRCVAIPSEVHEPLFVQTVSTNFTPGGNKSSKKVVQYLVRFLVRLSYDYRARYRTIIVR